MSNEAQKGGNAVNKNYYFESVDYIAASLADAEPELEVQIVVRNVYGNELIYPANFQAERFAAIAGKKSLSKEDLMNIKALGFKVVQVFNAIAA